jgi:protein gp37
VSDKTLISWTDASWPVVAGCDHVSPGCDNCYAAKLTGGRLRHLPAYAGLAGHGRFNGQIRLLPDRLDWPLRWRKPRKVFVSDMADLFHADVPDEYIARVWAVMTVAYWHTFQVLTKRHARMRSLLRSRSFAALYLHEYEKLSDQLYRENRRWADHFDMWERRWPLPNVWLGVSVEDQKRAELRIHHLLGTPAAIRFISAEPLLGPVNLKAAVFMMGSERGHGLTASYVHAGGCCRRFHGLDWVIAGGESGPGHRPMDVAWVESLARQCQAAEVPIWVKQDSGPRAGQQGRIPDDLWIHEFPLAAGLADAA